MRGIHASLLIWSVLTFALVGCATTSRIVTDPPGLRVSLNGQEFGPTPCEVSTKATSFGSFHLQILDEEGAVLHRQDLQKAFRVWGLFWPPYGVFYNLFELYPQYTAEPVTLGSGSKTWRVMPY